jgi:hypothetical protein
MFFVEHSACNKNCCKSITKGFYEINISSAFVASSLSVLEGVAQLLAQPLFLKMAVFCVVVPCRLA